MSLIPSTPALADVMRVIRSRYPLGFFTDRPRSCGWTQLGTGAIRIDVSPLGWWMLWRNGKLLDSGPGGREAGIVAVAESWKRPSREGTP